MKLLSKLIAALALIVLSYSQSFSQVPQDSTLFRVETSDGNEYVGRVVSKDGEKITIITEQLGEITLFTRDIKSINEVPISSYKDGKLWFENPQATRYF